MELYHGTPQSRGDKIVAEGEIRCDAPRIYEKGHEDVLRDCLVVSEGMIPPSTLASTPGYIYLTDVFIYAIYYGNKNAMQQDEKFFYVFKVVVDEQKLEPDEDEVRMCLFEDPSNYPTAKDTLKACKSARYGENISVFQYCTLPTSTNWESEHSRLITQIVREYNHNPETSNDYKRKHVNELIQELLKIVEWK